MCRKLVNKTAFQGILKLNLVPSFSSVADSKIRMGCKIHNKRQRGWLAFCCPWTQNRPKYKFSLNIWEKIKLSKQQKLRQDHIYPVGIKQIEKSWFSVVGIWSPIMWEYYRGVCVGGDSGAVGRISGFKWKPNGWLDETGFLHFNQQEMELQAIIHTARSLNFSAVAWNIFVSEGIKHVFPCVCVRERD